MEERTREREGARERREAKKVEETRGKSYLVVTQRTFRYVTLVLSLSLGTKAWLDGQLRHWMWFENEAFEV